ncbi:MAG: transcription-repair coupling factor, partial [Proteobacteria bacterium]|nr:transcription-repair coupling factor [Pseudomonadota bacterium]
AGDDDGDEPDELIPFPPYEVSPYDELTPPAEVTARRIAALYRLATADGPHLVVTTARALLARLMPKRALSDVVDYVEAGQETDREAFVARLVRGGYFATSLVEERGDFAVRGGVIDLYPPLADGPVRIDFLGDAVETIRPFDPLTQRSRGFLDDLIVLPAREVLLGPNNLDRAREFIRRHAPSLGLSVQERQDLLEKINGAAPFDGLAGLLPVFYSNTDSLFDYLAENWTPVVVEPEEVALALDEGRADAAARYERRRERGRFALPPDRLLLDVAEVRRSLAASERLDVTELAVAGPEATLVDHRARPLDDLRDKLYGAKAETSLLAPLAGQVKEWQAAGQRIVLACRGRGRAARLAELFAGHDLEARVVLPPLDGLEPGSFVLVPGDLSAGFALPDRRLIVIPESRLFTTERSRRARPKHPPADLITTFDEIKEGDWIVHEEHGVGRYRGLAQLDSGEDFLEIEYAGNDRLYLPVSRLHVISRYRGVSDRPPKMDRLGGQTWAKTKARVKKAVEKIARDLVELYAARQISPGYAFSAPDRDLREFEAAFPFQETPDQKRSIDDVYLDMRRDKPMDRLVCGDVGFGKTEVALRAAFLAVGDGKQVAYLVPTTVLAEQHFRTFTERLAPYPILVEGLSRFKSPARQKEILRRLGEGKLDIVIGTHRLLQKDVVFKNLGLVIVDEEQRFGVSHKEKLKRLRRQVDVLTLTATPIPRTMHMAMSGIRDLSVINTAPEGRLAVKTYLARFTPEIVIEAVEREVGRGGQVFFVHDRVKNIGAVARYLQKLLPRVRLTVAHGQMTERALENEMRRFVGGEVDVLVSTSIIESGLDIPAANTMIINQAHRFGLAQIYQLRGRVGRSDARAYAYLLIPHRAGLSKDARKRMRVLMDFSELGAGFQIALHDLRIRGAGNLLGDAQSGHAQAVGYDLYVAMLEREIRRRRGQIDPEAPPEIEPEVKLSLPARIPDDYISQKDLRLALYRRLAAVAGESELADVERELVDRFGPPPAEVVNLLRAVDLKMSLKRHRVTTAQVGPRGVGLTFAADGSAPVESILEQVRRSAAPPGLKPDGSLTIKVGPDGDPFAAAKNFLNRLG